MNFPGTITRLITLCIAGISLISESRGQSKPEGLSFFDGSLDAVMEEARKTGKPIMIDVYTTWCPPCKKMDKEVFSLPEIGEKFTASFVCYKADAEKGDGIRIKKKYEVASYPTYLFINEDGILLHKAVGYHPPAAFLQVADEAVKKAEGTQTIQDLQTEYDNGNRDLLFLKTYINKLSELKLGKKRQIVLDEYLSGLPEKKLEDAGEIGFILKHLVTVDSKAFSAVINRQELAAEAVSRDKTLLAGVTTGGARGDLGTILGNLVINSMIDAISQRDSALFNVVRENADRIENQSPLFPYTFFSFQMQFYKTTRDTTGMIKLAHRFLNAPVHFDVDTLAKKDKIALDRFMYSYRTGIEDSTAEKNFPELKKNYSHRITWEAARTLDHGAGNYYQQISSSRDLEEAIRWSQRAIVLVPGEPRFYQTLASLYYKTGRKAEAIATQETALRVAGEQLSDKKEVETYRKNLEAMRAGNYK